MAESKMAESKIKMAAINKLSQNEWVKFFDVQMVGTIFASGVSLRGNTEIAVSKMAKFKMAEFKMALIIKLSENEWVRVRLSEISLSQSQSGVRVSLSESERR